MRAAFGHALINQSACCADACARRARSVCGSRACSASGILVIAASPIHAQSTNKASMLEAIYRDYMVVKTCYDIDYLDDANLELARTAVRAKQDYLSSLQSINTQSVWDAAAKTRPPACSSSFGWEPPSSTKACTTSAVTPSFASPGRAMATSPVGWKRISRAPGRSGPGSSHAWTH